MQHFHIFPLSQKLMPQSDLRMLPMWCPTNSQARWSIPVFKFVIQWRLMLSWVVLIKVVKLLNTLPSKEDYLSQNMWYTSISQIFTVTMKSQTKTSNNCANLIKECIASNIYITTLKPNKVSTLLSKDILDLVEGIVGASNAIFMRKVWYLNKTHSTKLIIEIHIVLKFYIILLPLDSMISTSLVNSKCLLRIWLK